MSLVSLYDAASLWMTPSGAEDGKLFSQLPTDGSGDFTFTRGSNLAATRVGPTGLIEKGRENLLLQSNQFDTTWTKTNTSVTDGQSGYDGTNNAYLLTKSAANARINQAINNDGVQTFSVYAKAGTLDFVLLNNSLVSQWFDLSNGSVAYNSSASNTIDAKIEDVGNGWYRCSLTFSSTISVVRIYPSQANADVSATSGSIYIQDAQLEIGLAATEVITTGATTGKAGLLEDEPRLDYSGGVTCPSLLLEPSRTNLFGYSEYASGNTLTGSPIITENYAISPDGLSNAFRIQDTTGGTYKRITKAFSVSANSTYTQSLFVKKATSAVSTYGGIGFDYSGGTRQVSYIIFDEYNGTMTALESQSTLTLHDVEDYGDYWRFSISAEDTGSNTYQSINIYACLSANGTNVSAGIKDYTAYGLQLEQASYPTSYIPNHSGGSVTRNFDYSIVESLGYSSTYTFYYEFNTTTGRETSSPFAEVGKNQSNKIWIKGASANNPQFSVQGNGIFNGSISPTNEVSGTNKIAVQCSSGVGVVFCNGVKQSGTLTNSNTSENIDFISAKGQGTSHDLKQLLFFEEALSDAECITLTQL